MASAPKFKYKELDETKNQIRLLTLEPALHEDNPIKCSLNNVDINNPGDYEALSYVWGKPTIKKPIILEGYHFEVTVNLCEVLKTIRPEGSGLKPRIVWIDAICIDQLNIPERNLRVQTMRMIYRQASRVLIYLGGFETDTLECFALIHRIHAHLVIRAPALETEQRLQNMRTRIRKANLVMSDVPSLGSPAWDHLALLFAQPWFNRVWVIQEVTEARNPVVMYGGGTISWTIVEIVAQWVMSTESPELHRKFGTRGIVNAIFMGQKEFKLQPGDNVLELFHRVRDFEATDARDKVFAMLTHPV